MPSDSMSSDSPDLLVTRFAPSPTGYLHLGNARTALLSFLAARKAGGRFILRVEDTDEARSSEEFMVALYADLKWLGMDWDEGPDIGGPHAPYRQQERRALYDEWLSRLDAAGLTYPCFCTPTELSISRKRQLAAGQPPRYAGTCRNLTTEERAERLARGLPAALRFRVPEKQVVSFVDVVHGEQRFNTDDIGDFIIRRTDGSTAFFFSNAVDDALMGVTLVLRGDDHMTNTPRQILILQALSLRIPQYAHVALLLGMDGAPLSKRHGDTSLRDLREHGYLPGALRNHLVRLGHSCVSDGWLDEAGVIADFDLNRLGRAAAKFDEAQLRHWQKETVAHLSAEEFLNWIAAELPPSLDPQQQAQFVTVARANIELPSDAKIWAKVIFGKLDEFEPAALAAIREAGEGFFTEALQVIGHPGSDFKQAVKALGQATGKKGPALFMPLRAALTGFTHGPELAPMLAMLPFAEVQARLEHARRLAA
ncbi:glutamate--tRNA ligase [Steroidobacter cummioxidans]|uniref:glutamate--tRNA ligase n=1 Tax=Steroidobacter cummioxidans TaxID=1803913 RepID=UPI0019D46C89|nr:glutamate--tRNA ligase [Steroidobacter cummioxidans]